MLGQPFATSDCVVAHLQVWFPFNDTDLTVQLAPQTELGRELYPHKGDSGRWMDNPAEVKNIVHDPANQQVVARLHQRVVNYVQLK